MMNERNDNEAERWWQVWLDELESGKPNVERAAEAARQLATAKPSKAQLRQWLAAIGSDVDDPLTCTECQARLPDFLVAQAEAAATSPNFDEVRIHLAQCPYCTEAYAESAGWLAASMAENVPVSQSYPNFDFAFLSAPSPATPTAARARTFARHIGAAMTAGRRWLRESNGILILFGPGLQSEPGLAWAVKSAGAGTLLAQLVLSEEEMHGWEVTIAAFAQEAGAQDESATLCQLEVALYRGGDLLEDIPIRVVINEKEHTGQTDSEGVAIFNDIPMAQLGDVMVHVGVDPT